MVDKEKVMTWLEICGENRDCSGTCPYSENGFGEYGQCRETLMADALELLKEQEAKKVIESTNIVRCDDCGYSFCEGFVRERLYCEKHPELGEIKGDWFCADCWKA